jgi:WhiB family transcriptional regulator, redox-sensing transcriptional regulator
VTLITAAAELVGMSYGGPVPTSGDRLGGIRGDMGQGDMGHDELIGRYGMSGGTGPERPVPDPAAGAPTPIAYRLPVDGDDLPGDGGAESIAESIEGPVESIDGTVGAGVDEGVDDADEFGNMSAALSRVDVLGTFGTPDDEEPDWQERALCAQTDPEAFFPEKGGSTREAKRICSGCEVRAECLEYALAHDERFGIWGGLSERERRRLRRGAV